MSRLVRAAARCILGITLLASCASPPDPRPARDAAWQSTLDDLRSRATALGIPGVGVAVVLDGRLTYSGGIGVRSRATGGAVTGDTLFRSSSAATKPMIALALLDMAEEGLVDLRAPLSTLLPAFRVDAQYAPGISLDTVLLQRSGLVPVDYRRACEGETSVLGYFTHAGQLTSLAPPDAIWEYTALGSVAGAAVIESTAQRPFAAVLRERVLLPAGMTTATFDPQEAAAREHALGHLGSAELEPTDDHSYACGERVASTGLYASAADHGRFLELLLAPGRVVSAASLATLEGAAHNPGFGPLWSYGYQAFGLTYRGVRVYHHYGSSEGFTCGVSWIPERGFGVVLLTNADEGRAYGNVYAVEELRWRIIDRFLGLQGAEPDNSTAPATWSRYTGTYVDPAQPDTRLVVAQDAMQRLSASIEPAGAAAVTLTQGALDAPYEGGDVFGWSAGSSYLFLGFFPGPSGTIDYVNTYSSAIGHRVVIRQR